MRRDGGILIVALTTVAVVAMLSLALGAWVRAQAALLQADRYRRDVGREAFNAANLFVAERLALDTNEWDAATETWGREPWERREEGWIMRVSGQGWGETAGSTTALSDECGKLSLNHASPELLAALLHEATALAGDDALALARRIVDWRDSDDQATGSETSESLAYGRTATPWEAPNRPFIAVEELAAIPGIEPRIVALLSPLLTIHSAGLVNINTAPDTVLRALIASSQAGDYSAAQSLADRLEAYRAEGGIFFGADAKTIGKTLGGLPAAEALLLGRMEPLLSASSIAFSGVAEATPAAAWAAGRAGGRARFVWSRKERDFTSWVED